MSCDICDKICFYELLSSSSRASSERVPSDLLPQRRLRRRQQERYLLHGGRVRLAGWDQRWLLRLWVRSLLRQ